MYRNMPKINQMGLNKVFAILSIFLIVIGCGSEKKEPAKLAEKKVNNTLKMFEKLVAAQTGISFNNTISPDQELVFYDFQYQFNGGGVGIADFDNDGLSDVFFAGNEVSNKLYLNLGELKFEDITDKANVGQLGSWVSGVTIVDINSDGFQDIYLSRGGFNPAEQRKNSLLINNGDLTFTEAAEQYGIADTGFTTQSAFFDYDLDGDLDLFVMNHSNTWSTADDLNIDKYKKRQVTEDRLYNNENGKFTDVTPNAGFDPEIAGGYGLGISVGDFNNDNYPDLYISNDYDSPDRMYINQQDGTFKNETKERTTHIALYSMGNDVADLNNDGFIDVIALDMSAEDHVRIKTQMGAMAPEKFYELVRFGFPLQYMYNTLQLNNGNGTFSDIAQLAGISSTDWSWAPLMADFDNDGEKDIFISNGYRLDDRDNDYNNSANKLYGKRHNLTKEERRSVFDGTPSTPLSNYMYKNNGDLTFSKKTFEWNLGEKSFSMGAAFADLDNDGDLELITNNLESEAFVYKNNAIEKLGNNFLRVNLEGNKTPLEQSKVVITVNGKSQTQFFNPTRGYISSVETVIHFGLGQATNIDRVEVFWTNGKYSVVENVKPNQTISININSKSTAPKVKEEKKLFTLQEKQAIEFLHAENDHDDFEKEILLPHRNSQHGPELAVADVNNDGLQDVFFCNAYKQPSVLYLQTSPGVFKKKNVTAFTTDKNKEDVGAHFFDYNNDGFMDLYVASGGNEFEDQTNSYKHRLYKNDGKGNFTNDYRSLPDFAVSGKEVTSADFDGDGDLDLFVGGRLTPAKYPFAPRSYLLINNNGVFEDKTKELAPDLMNPGLVTDAKWFDYDGDKDLDLMVVGEWMPLLLLKNENGKLSKVESAANLYENTGWWYSIETADFDGDGDEDIVVGNLGLNYKYKASKDEPFQIWCHDFDNSGSLDIVLGYYDHGACFPVRGRTCSSQQMPFIKEKFPTFNDFASATIEDIYGSQLSDALNYKATTFANSYIENLGKGKFKISKLPNELQFSCVQSMIIKDFNKDGNLDILGAGNLYTAEVETPRNDASIGFLALGNGKGQFSFQPYKKSGVFLKGDVKDMADVKINDDEWFIIVGLNDEKNKILKY